MTNSKDIVTKVYTKKCLPKMGDMFCSTDRLKVYSKLNKSKKTNDNSSSKVLKRKVLNSSSNSSGQVKRGPGRPKKVLKEDDGCNNNGDIKNNRLKLDCNPKIKHKVSNSSSSDLSPPVLEPWSPFSPRKDSTHTPPTLSPISSVAKLYDIQKSSDDEKKIAKRRLTASILV